MSLTSETDGADIYYTTDGSTPSYSATLYDEPFEITAATTVKAIAYADGYSESEVMEVEYTITTEG